MSSSQLLHVHHVLQPLTVLEAFWLTLSHTLILFLYWRESKTGHSTQMKSWQMTSLAPLLIQLKTLLATFAARAHCWLVFKLSTRTPRSLSARVAYKQPPACTVAWGYSFPDARLCNCSCWTLGKFASACFSRLWSSLWRAALPSSWIQLSKFNKRM